MDIGIRPKISFTIPFDSIDKDKIHIQHKKDSLFIDQDFEIRTTPGKFREFEIRTRLTPGESYKIAIDSAAMTNIYGLHNNTYSKAFSVKKIEDYASLLFHINPIELVCVLLLSPSNFSDTFPCSQGQKGKGRVRCE